MKRHRGFKIGQRFVKIFKWIVRPRRIKPGKHRYPTRVLNPVTRICSLARCLRRGAKRLCGKNTAPAPGAGQILLGKDPNSAAVVPKGHLAVYIGESGGDTRRVLVPVIHFNHPLFGELLEQAEQVYGFDQPGRITIPCRVSDFEKVQMRIAAWDHCRRKRSYKIV
ncbi:PREDICTED: indole-3-acetic acid-induced protein ARG7-like [Tarenaya hassleriana]|uniref:indole-3-acetic acid-induced protein ARG7-like n=1 Tax=Tarenaya hassleriana TaxID=28532 RepID=UPI00053C52AF|nr:PREDICTED: indole-3-acetic acid-induced protein ARG7-like [Tarenaya hassleriana]